MKTKLILLVTSLSALVCTVKASAPDKAQVEAHYKSYHAAGKAVVEMAMDMLAEISRFRDKEGRPCRLRIGINTGPVVASSAARSPRTLALAPCS